MEEIFKRYGEVRGRFLDANSTEHLDFTRKIVEKNYSFTLNESASILDIGCNKGYFLRLMQDNGYTNLIGLDLSVVDLNFARGLLGDGPKLIQQDLFEFLKTSKEQFDLIWCKAVQEHIPKEKQFEFVELVSSKLKKGGKAIVSVPNMDWFGATHERYMDFTHEIGFTKESLGDVYRMVLNSDDFDIVVKLVSYDFPSSGLLGRLRKLLFVRPMRWFVKLQMRAIGSGMPSISIFNRAIAVEVTRK